MQSYTKNNLGRGEEQRGHLAWWCEPVDLYIRFVKLLKCMKHYLCIVLYIFSIKRRLLVVSTGKLVFGSSVSNNKEPQEVFPYFNATCYRYSFVSVKN
jgi:hypothetical protein